MKKAKMNILTVCLCASAFAYVGCDDVALRLIDSELGKRAREKEIAKGKEDQKELSEIKKRIKEEGWPGILDEPVRRLTATKAALLQKNFAAKTGLPVQYTNSIGMQFSLVPAAVCSFSRISDSSILARKDRIFAVAYRLNNALFISRRAIITKPFYAGVYEVTVGDFKKFTKDTGYQTDAETGKVQCFGWDEKKQVFSLVNENPFTWKNTGFPQTDNHPVVNLTLDDMEAFIRWLSEKDQREYQLPTDTQWGLACRACFADNYNTDSPFYAAGLKTMNTADASAMEILLSASKDTKDCNDEDMLWTLTMLQEKDNYAKFELKKYDDGFVFTSPVGKLKPNNFGLYDMHGKVSEICRDGYLPVIQKGASRYQCDPVNPITDEMLHSLCGGSWSSLSYRCQTGMRLPTEAKIAIPTRGFRLIVEIQKPAGEIKAETEKATEQTASNE